MIHPDTVSSSIIYCPQCGYQLTGLSEPRCPECGRGFDPTNPRTFLRHPKGWLLRRWLRRGLYVLLGLLVIVSVVAGRVGWLYWSWRSQQPLVAAIRQAGAEPMWLEEPSYFRSLLPTQQWGHDRPNICRQIAGIYFSMRRTGVDAILARMPSHPNLQDVCLSDTDVSDEGLRVLKDWTQIRHLSLGKRISDAGLANLRNMTRLWQLVLSDTQVTDDGMEFVGQLPALRWLWLNNTAITDEGMAALAKASTLDTVVMNGTKITDAGLVHLQKLGRLRQLLLTDTKVTDAGMDALAQVPALERVTLMRTGITDAGLAILAKMPALRYVNIRGTHVTPAMVESLKQSRPELEIEGP